MAVRNRALTLATRGLLAGSALALATGGLLQVDTGAAGVVTEDATHLHTSEPVSFTCKYCAPLGPELVPARAGGGSTYIHYREVPKRYKYLSQAKFILVGDSLAWLEKHRPVVKAEPPRLHAVIDSHGELRLLSNGKWSFWDQGQDDGELVMLLAMNYFLGDRNV